MLDVRPPKARKQRFDALPDAAMVEVLGRMRAWGETAGQRARANRDADLVELLLATGLRKAELARLRKADVDLAARRMFVEGKTDDVYVPIAEEIVPVLERMLARAFRDGRLIRSAGTVEELFKAWRRRLGLPKFSAHMMRHSLGSSLAAAGVDPFVIRDALRHATLTQSARYVHAAQGRVDRAVDDLMRRLRQQPPLPPTRRESTANGSPATARMPPQTP